jgi:hypothetical protein
VHTEASLRLTRAVLHGRKAGVRVILTQVKLNLGQNYRFVLAAPH